MPDDRRPTAFTQGGERQSDRDACERLERRFVDSGVDPSRARDMARKTARESEHKVKHRGP